MARGLWVAALLAPCADPCWGQARPRSEAADTMARLSQHFRALELRLGEGDLAALAALAGEVRGLTHARLPIAVGRGAAPAEDFAAAVARLDGAAVELEQLAGQANLLGAAQAFEGLRAACVSCHVRFRPDNDVRGNFPARDNTIAGSAELLDAAGRPRANRAWVLAFLESPPGLPPFTHARANPGISQSGRRFEPRVLPVLVGTTVDFPNDDTIFHNVFSLSKAAPFDLGVYEPGQTAAVRMERTGLVKVYCNIHPDMAASIVVLANPWFALTDSAGRFVISGVPDGEYTLRAWNDMGAESRQPIELRGGRVHEARVELRETRRSLEHTNKFGAPYTGKYR